MTKKPAKVEIQISTNLKETAQVLNVCTMPIQKKDYRKLEYIYLLKYFGVLFYTKEECFNFGCERPFYIFAYDIIGNCYGTIDFYGDISDENCKIGYVDIKNKRCGIIADNIKQFLELVVFFPNWYDEKLALLKMCSNYKKAQNYMTKKFNLKYISEAKEKVKEESRPFGIYEGTNYIKEYSCLFNISIQ